ncbi:phosphatase PAP2 family protein [Luteipulveratus mongoliensis]|uniref:Inositolphosphotransferase Aur1/Ipt1 domain-containing protein n=1 Tax=Luteipulveratus mongoliensis TaxID=571913 RepID=A0A0K1JKR2_9MICO|nr:phosphatase PAP2 family protein [Luteipulveratus mongoliensis]AKU17309.1 hypothetical protein VV02_18045 [Luteipulveratus mongoliensis]
MAGDIPQAARPAVQRRPSRNELVVLGVLFLLVVGLFALYGPLNHGPARWNLRTPIDEHIPLVKQLVVPYVSILALAPLSLLLFAVRAPQLARSALVSAVLLLVVAFVFYVFAQTHVPRPVVRGDDVFARMLRAVYGNDEAYNCFPSLHAGFSVIIGVHWLRYNARVGRYVAAWCALIMASTVFVHQHYIADMLGGLVVAGAACWVGRLSSQPQHADLIHA